MELRSDVLEAQMRAAQSDLKVYDVRAGADLMTEYRRLAKVADQRLVRIEAAKHDKGYGAIEKYAYANAMRSIHSFSGESAKRFNTKPPENPQALQRKINDILVFLNSPTSTKSGVKKVYEKRAKAFNETFRDPDTGEPANFTWQELEALFNSRLWHKLDGLPYRTAFYALANLSRKKGKEKDAIIKELKKNGKSANVKLSDEDTNDAIVKAIAEHADELSNILK